jgi:hypothetical protein
MNREKTEFPTYLPLGWAESPPDLSVLIPNPGSPGLIIFHLHTYTFEFPAIRS